MSTNVIPSQYERPLQKWMGRMTVTDPIPVVVTRSVDANRSRIFQALTIAEYMEAWFVAPDMIAGSATVLTEPDCFLVSYNSCERGRQSFVGSYKQLRRGKVQFWWRRDSFGETNSSLVKVRLQGDFGRTTVLLEHTGLDGPEQLWYRMLWEASLERLATLF